MSRLEQTTAANTETNSRLAPINPKAPLVLGPMLSGVLGLLTLLAGSIAAASAALPGVLPVGVVLAATIAGPVLAAGAYWARGGVLPQDLLDGAVAAIKAAAKKTS